MAIKEDLETKVADIFLYRWSERDGTVIPDSESVGLGNTAVKLDATVLYADLSESTFLVDSKSDWFAAEIYKSYLMCCARIINEFDGEVTAYDGDRIMAVFIGDSKNSSAVKAALKINAAVKDIINPAIVKQYGDDMYMVKQVVGIDTSELFVAKTGVRGANDLVWVGRAANYAAKLCSLSVFDTYITHSVYERLSKESKFAEEVNMWTKLSWTQMNGFEIYGSSYQWSL